MSKNVLKEFIKKLIMKEFEDIVYPIDPTAADNTSDDLGKDVDTEENSWTMANGDKVIVKDDIVVLITKEGKKYYMPRDEWEHNDNLLKSPNWREMK